MAKSITIPAGVTEQNLHDALIFKATNKVDLGVHKMSLTATKLEKLAEVGRALMLNGKHCFFCCGPAPKQKKPAKKTKAAMWEATVLCDCAKHRIAELIPQPKPKTAPKAKGKVKAKKVQPKDPNAQAILDGLAAGTIKPTDIVHTGPCVVDGCKEIYAVSAEQVKNHIEHLKLAPASYRWTHRCPRCKRAAQEAKRRSSNAAPVRPPPQVREIEGVEVSTEAEPLRASLGDVAGTKKAVATA